MSDATMTSKGQVTIPVDVRKAANLNAKDKLSFNVMPDGSIVIRVKNRSFVDLQGMLKDKTKTKVSVDQMNLGSA